MNYLEIILFIILISILIILLFFKNNTENQIINLKKLINKNLSLENSNIKDIIEDANHNYRVLEIKNKKLEKNQEKIYSNIEDEL